MLTRSSYAATLKQIYRHLNAFRKMITESPYIEDRKIKDKKIKILVLYSAADLNYRKDDTFYADKLDTILLRNLSIKYNIIRAIKPPSQIIDKNLVSFNKIYFRELLNALISEVNIFKKRKRVYLNSYDKILLRVNPKFVISMDADTNLIKACQKRNIVYIEAQHGVINVKSTSIQYAADHNIIFIVWDSFHEKALRSIGAKNIIKVGVPSLYPINSEETSRTKIKTIEEKEILILLTWKLSNSIDRYGTISKSTYSMISKILERLPSQNLRVRLHPVSVEQYGIKKMKKNVFNVFQNKNIIVENPWEVRISYSLDRAKYVVGYPSATLIEAAAKGIPCFFEYSELFIDCIDPDFIKNGYVSFFKNIDNSFLEKINSFTQHSIMSYDVQINDINEIENSLDLLFRS